MEKDLLFETILFYQDAPCYYNVIRSEDEFIFKPKDHHFYKDIEFPELSVKKNAGNWMVNGQVDERLREQVLADLKKNLGGALCV